MVKQGDTLFDLASNYLVHPGAYRQLQRINRVTNPWRLPIGRELRMPRALLRWDPDQARIVHFRGTIRLGSGEAPALGGLLGEGASLTTGANSFVRLAFSDGSHVTVPSNSRVRIARLRRYRLHGAVEQSLMVEAGRAEAEAAPRRRPGGFEVRTPVSVSAVRGTEFRVSYREAVSLAGTEVLEGRVAVAAGDAIDAIDADHGVVASVSGLAPVDVLLGLPTLREPDAVQAAETLRFEVEPLAGAAAYRARLATDAGMVEAFAETDTVEGEVGFGFGEPVPDGRYFVRLTALSPAGLEGRPRTYSVLRVRNVLDRLTASPFRQDGRRFYRFRWRAGGEGDARFRFRLWTADDLDAPPVVDRPGLSSDDLTISDLPPGNYEWRVEAVRERFGRSVGVWSDVQALHVGR